MSFQIIKADTRTARMIEWFSGICRDVTDFVVGSKIRSKFETIAIEMEAQDFAWYQSLKKAIPTAIYRAFDFNLLPAQKATGQVTFYTPEPATAIINIPAGTQVATAATISDTEKIYITDAAVSIQIGQTSVTTNITCIIAGTAGNTGSGSITVIKSSLTGVSSVANAEPVSGGSERETEERRRIRFIEYVNTLSRGTIAAVEYGAKTAFVYNEAGEVIESVQDAIVYEPFMHDNTKPVGVFQIYLYNGYGDTSPELLASAQQIVDGYTTPDGTRVPGWKAAGVICQVLAATETVLDVTAEIFVKSGYDTTAIEETATNVCDEYISGIGIGKAFIYNELIERIMGIDGVYNCNVASPSVDQVPEFNEVFVAGTKMIAVTTP